MAKKNKQTNFHISISDSFVEYRFPLDLPDSYSINKVYREICKNFKIVEHPGTVREGDYK